MPHSEEYMSRVNASRKSILRVSLFVMLLGGCIFTLGVVSRPIIRITKTDHIPTVRWMIDVMVSAGIMQIVAAGYDIFTGIWRLMWPIYLGIAITGLTVLLELTAIGSSLYLYIRSEFWVNEELVHPWYWVECLQEGSCHNQMLRYLHFFIAPQLVIAVVSVVLQCITIMMLGRLVRTITDHFRVLQEAQAKYQEEWEEKKFNFPEDSPILSNNNNIEEDDDIDATSPADSINGDGILKTPKRVQFQEDEENPPSATRRRTTRGGAEQGKDEYEMVHTSTFEAQIHAVVEMASPCSSIITGDHGYVAGSRVSLDYDKVDKL